MEADDWEMSNKHISYTNEDVWILIQDVSTSNILWHTALVTSFRGYEFSGWSERLKTYVRIVKEQMGVKYNGIGPPKNIYQIVYQIPFEMLPLYINNTHFDMFIRWRLKIGK